MATLQERNGSYRILFVYHGKRLTFTVGKVTAEEAQAKADQVDYLLLRLRQKLISLPASMDVVTFIQFDGKPPDIGTPQQPKAVTLGLLRDRYLTTHKNGALEKTTIDGIELHFNHLTTTLGEKFPVQSLSLAELQRHVDRRAKMKGIRGRMLSPATIKKEVVTLRAAWNWAVKMKIVSGRFPYDGRRYPKTDEKPPFMTWEEIERRLPGLKAAEQAELWDCIFLTQSEIAGLLEHVRSSANQPWIYPAVCFAAHTGARRGEIFRVRVHDIDFAGETVLIHEKKRVRGKRTTRRVPLSPFLLDVLKTWLATHPGTQYLFSQNTKIVRSKTKRIAPMPVTRDEAHNHLQRTLAGSKWQVLKGWHTLRHSFISCCASRGVDQRLIDEWVGHTTEEMRRRYRHLIPSTEKKAIRSVFGEG